MGMGMWRAWRGGGERDRGESCFLFFFLLSRRSSCLTRSRLQEKRVSLFHALSRRRKGGKARREEKRRERSCSFFFFLTFFFSFVLLSVGAVWRVLSFSFFDEKGLDGRRRNRREKGKGCLGERGGKWKEGGGLWLLCWRRLVVFCLGMSRLKKIRKSFLWPLFLPSAKKASESRTANGTQFAH